MSFASCAAANAPPPLPAAPKPARNLLPQTLAKEMAIGDSERALGIAGVPGIRGQRV